MDPATISLILVQSITFVLLVISETLPIADTPYNGIIQGLLHYFQSLQLPKPAPTIVVANVS